MILGPGATTLEQFAITLDPTLTLEECRAVVENVTLWAINNKVEVASARLVELEMIPPMSGRFVFPVGISVKEGDDVTLEMRSNKEVKLAKGFAVHAECNVIGKTSRGELVRLLGQPGNWPLEVVLDSANAAT